jgi:ABC-type antimicrobial peptide transport system permease subunit
MIELARMPDLERLDLSHTRITDEGMLNLKPAPKISELKLFYSEWITDQGMRAPMAQRRGIAFLLCVFSAVAVALAAIGIYSVISYATGLRVQEIGIRMAYGPDIRTR